MSWLRLSYYWSDDPGLTIQSSSSSDHVLCSMDAYKMKLYSSRMHCHWYQTLKLSGTSACKHYIYAQRNIIKFENLFQDSCDYHNTCLKVIYLNEQRIRLCAIYQSEDATFTIRHSWALQSIVLLRYPPEQINWHLPFHSASCSWESIEVIFVSLEFRGWWLRFYPLIAHNFFVPIYRLHAHARTHAHTYIGSNTVSNRIVKCYD